jgi:hypothetical protein
MKWYRVWNGTPSDPKWRVVARRSKQPITHVLSIWQFMMDCAGGNKPPLRGTLAGWDDEEVAASLDLETEVVTAVREAMQGLTLDGETLKAWDKRQFASDSSAKRVAEHRARKKASPDDDNPGGNSAETPRNGAKANGKHGNDTVTLQSEKPKNVTLQAADVTLQEPDLGECNVTLSARDRLTEKESNSVADATAQQAAPGGSLKDELFGSCLKWLTGRSGRQEAQLRKVLGKWVRDHGEGAVLNAISVAQRDSAVSPVGYVEKILQRRGSNVHPLEPRRSVAMDSGHARLLRRAAEERAKAAGEQS